MPEPDALNANGETNRIRVDVLTPVPKYSRKCVMLNQDAFIALDFRRIAFGARCSCALSRYFCAFFIEQQTGKTTGIFGEFFASVTRPSVWRNNDRSKAKIDVCGIRSVTIDPQFLTFLCGAGGSAAVEVVTINQFYHEEPFRLPERYTRFGFWIVRVLLAVIAGGLAMAYKIDSPVLAINIGAATPLIVRAFSDGIKPSGFPSSRRGGRVGKQPPTQ